MKKSEVKIGSVYTAMISGKLTKVRINVASEHGGWNATNLTTQREVRIKSAMKLRKEVVEKAPVAARTVPASLPALPDVAEVVESTRMTPLPEKPVAVSTPNPKWSRLEERINARKNTVDTSPHLIVEARAGTGKTTTLVEGLKRIQGVASSLVPSPQQAAVWEVMGQSKGLAQSICFVAFNKAIAEELQKKMPVGCSAMTLHSMGFQAVKKAFPGKNVNQWRVQDIISEILNKDIRELRKNDPVLVSATETLVGLCKQNLVGVDDFPGELESSWEEALDRLAGHYDVELNGQREKVYALVPKVLERCKDVARDAAIDFNDMIWLPVALNLPCYKYDVLLVDEAQDLNRCQQQLALRSGRRLILCGDPRQAIYGFAGADSESMPRMEAILSGTDRGCRKLPLTVTRRCGKKIVEEAKRIVPDFEAFETNGEGKVYSARYEPGLAPSLYGSAEAPIVCDPDNTLNDPEGGRSYHALAKDGDMVLCRVNAPLVSQCFRFLKAGRKANIQGRDIGKGLISTINKLKAKDVADLITRIGDWADGEIKKANASKNPNENKIIAVQDRRDCLIAFCEDAKTIEDVTKKIETIFTDSNTTGIRLSSIHKAKGLEAKRVFFLTPKGAECPHPMAKSAWQRGQEMNLRYVAITRAIEELVYVS